MQKAFRKNFPILVLPTLAAYVIAFLIPFVLGIYLSFTKFTTVTDAQWIGLKNYAMAFKDKDFLSSLFFTVKFTVVNVVTVNLAAFALANVLSQTGKGTNFFRTVIFMPNLLGGIVLGYIWQVIINGVLAFSRTTLTASAKYGFWGMVVALNWQMIGYMMIIYIAGIQNIPGELMEAAKMDGATGWQILRKVTIPMVMPSVTICTFLTLSNSFKLFDQNKALTNGAPMNKTEMLALNIYNTFYGRPGFEGVGQAKAVIFFLLVAGIALIQLRMTRGKEVEQ